MARVIVIRNDYNEIRRPEVVLPSSPTKRFQYATARKGSLSRFTFDDDDDIKPTSPTRRLQPFTTRKGSNSRFKVEEYDVELPPILVNRLHHLGSYKRKHVIPEFNSRLDDQWHHHGDTILLRITFKGSPAPSVTWFKDHDLVSSTMRTMVYSSDTSSELVIYDAQKSDSGFYTCRIENQLGVRDTNCQVYIGDNGNLKSKGTKTLAANPRAYKSILYTPSYPSYRYF